MSLCLPVAFGVLVAGLWLPVAAADLVRLATYNVENYILVDTGARVAKAPASRAKVAEIIRGIGADIIALQEIGGRDALEDLRSRTRGLGLDYPHWEHVPGFDTNIQVALLSRFPIVARRPHTHDTYLLSGRRLSVSRGILEVDVRVGPEYMLTIFSAHLKSRRPIPEADEGDMRRAEARILRGKIDQRLKEFPRANIVLLGDLNDTKDSEPLRMLAGRGGAQLVDIRPAERVGNDGTAPDPRWEPRTVTWTHYYGKEDTYGRIDYIFLHPNTVREWVRSGTYIPSIPDWGLASDHRPLIVTLEAGDR